VTAELPDNLQQSPEQLGNMAVEQGTFKRDKLLAPAVVNKGMLICVGSSKLSAFMGTDQRATVERSCPLASAMAARKSSQVTACPS